MYYFCITYCFEALPGLETNLTLIAHLRLLSTYFKHAPGVMECSPVEDASAYKAKEGAPCEAMEGVWAHASWGMIPVWHNFDTLSLADDRGLVGIQYFQEKQPTFAPLIRLLQSQQSKICLLIWAWPLECLARSVEKSRRMSETICFHWMEFIAWTVLLCADLKLQTHRSSYALS